MSVKVRDPSSSWFRRNASAPPIPRPHKELDPYLKESCQQMLQMTMERIDEVTQTWQAGDVVLTQYGSGHILDHPQMKGGCVVQNSNGSYSQREAKSVKLRLDWGGIMHCPQSHTIHKLLPPEEQNHVMEHLEQIRRLNLSIQTHDWGLSAQHEDACVACLFQKPFCNATTNNGRRFFTRQASGSSVGTSSTNKVTTKTKRCDVCGSPVCSQHQVAMEGLEFFTLCPYCSHDLNETEHNLHPRHPQLLENLQRLNLHYTRMVTQLTYYVPNLKKIGYDLTHKQKRDGAVNLGNSALGFAGAALGVASAAAMLTPAGPALLVAAVATSATSGTFSSVYAGYNMLSPKTVQQLADRCLGWYGLCLGILRSLERLRQDLIQQQHDFEDNTDSNSVNTSVDKMKNSLEVWNLLAKGSFSTTRSAMTGIGVTSSWGVTYSQAISNGLSAIPVVGTAFAIGCMAFDGTYGCEAKRCDVCTDQD